MNKNPVIIQREQTALRIYCQKDGNLCEAPSTSIFPFLKTCLSEYEWDPRKHANVLKYQYFRYDPETGELSIPSHLLPFLAQYLKTNLINYHIERIPYNQAASINIQNISDMNDRDYQIESIDQITIPGMRALELQTGSGKTYTAIRAIYKLQQRAIIIVPASLLIQWRDALQTLIDGNICLIQGSKSIENIINSDFQDDVDIYLASITTMQEYASGKGVYESILSLRLFMQRSGIGIKIVDEAHVNFAAIVNIDLQSNVCYNIYLSATYMRSSKNSEQIFQRIFPREIKYIGKEYDKYVNITECRYSLSVPQNKVVTQRGYSQFKYEKFIMRHPRRLPIFIEDILHPVIYKYYIQQHKPGQKLLILVALREFAEFITEWFQKEYPEYNTAAFLHGTDSSILDEADVIISTPGSCGTGRDIKHLRTVIMLISFSSESLATQTLGRLRKLPHDTPDFIYLVNMGIPDHLRQAKKRRFLYRSLGKTFNVTDLRVL